MSFGRPSLADALGKARSVKKRETPPTGSVAQSWTITRNIFSPIQQVDYIQPQEERLHELRIQGDLSNYNI
jgi:hypothetical protein